MILAFTGAGISKASGIPTFDELGDLREKLSRDFVRTNPEEYKAVIEGLQKAVDKVEPNDAHRALAEYKVPVMTMNIDGLHNKAGSTRVIEMHGRLSSIVLYGDPAPRYQDALDWLWFGRDGDVLLIVGTSYYTTIASMIKFTAMSHGFRIVEINEDAEHRVRDFLEKNSEKIESLEERRLQVIKEYENE